MSEKKLKYILFPIAFLLVLIPHYLYYHFHWIKYVYLICFPFYTIKLEIDKFKFSKKINSIDFLTFSILIVTTILSFINLSFIDIFVWQITLGTFGLMIGLFSDKELKNNQFVKYWSRISFIGVFLFFVLKQYYDF